MFVKISFGHLIFLSKKQMVLEMKQITKNKQQTPNITNNAP